MNPNILFKSYHDDMIFYYIEKFKNYPSIRKSKEVTNLGETFTSNFITVDATVNKINYIEASIHTKIVVGNSRHICTNTI